MYHYYFAFVIYYLYCMHTHIFLQIISLVSVNYDFIFTLDRTKFKSWQISGTEYLILVSSRN